MNQKQKIIKRRFFVVQQLKEVPNRAWFKVFNTIYYKDSERYLRLTETNHLELIFQKGIEEINEVGEIEILKPVEFLFEQHIIT